MTTTTWTLTIEGKPHRVRLVHGYWSGKREIWVDNFLVEKSRKLFDTGSRHAVTVDGHEFELAILLTNQVTFSYALLQNGVPVSSDRDREKGKTSADLLQATYHRDYPFWQELSRLLGLPYQASQGADWAYRHRVIGVRKGYPVLVQKGLRSGNWREVWRVIVRFAPLSSEQDAERIRSDDRILALLGNLKKEKGAIGSDQDSAYILLPKIKKETPTELAIRIQTFLAVVSLNARPLNDRLCESRYCARQPGSDVKLVLINGMPQYLCTDCITAMPSQVAKAEQSYRKAPNNLFPGLIAGIGVAVVGAVVLAGATIILGGLGFFIPALIFIAMIRVFDKVGTKPSRLSLLLAATITFGSVTLGNLFLAFLTLVREGMPVALKTIGLAWQTAFDDKRFLSMLYIITFLYAGQAFLSFWLNHRQQLAEAFHPKIEILN